MMVGAIKVSKLDAARRQLRTAITLWFGDGDPVATHTLAFASYEILHVVSKKRDPNRMPLIFDTSFIKDEMRSEINVALKKCAVFFKHGDRDPDGIIEFDPRMTDGFILFAIAALQQCGEDTGDEESAFLLWLHLHDPSLVNAPLDSPPLNNVNQLRQIAKGDFLQTYKLGRAHHGR
jgi:hypothetical protein